MEQGANSLLQAAKKTKTINNKQFHAKFSGHLAIFADNKHSNTHVDAVELC